MPARLVAVDSISVLHADVTREATRLHVLNGERLHCTKGCSSCCVDDLTVFAVEIASIRLHHAELLASGTPHATGSCAFLDSAGACRIYADRPYVCRTQGLPLRWIEDREEGAVELRDICHLNDVDVDSPLEALPAEACWTLGPVEERLVLLQIAAGTGSHRERLRDLFATGTDGHPVVRGPSSVEHSQRGIVMGDKSPKAKDKNKKQHTADKDQKKGAAAEKAKAPDPTKKK